MLRIIPRQVGSGHNTGPGPWVYLSHSLTVVSLRLLSQLGFVDLVLPVSHVAGGVGGVGVGGVGVDDHSVPLSSPALGV